VARLRDGLTVAGLTGSQAKTSTKDLLAAVLSSAAPTIATIGSLNNELGVPLTMLRADAATRFLVLEMGARHIGDIAELTGLLAELGAAGLVTVADKGYQGSTHAKLRASGERANAQLKTQCRSGELARDRYGPLCPNPAFRHSYARHDWVYLPAL
jgi:UDP-N-acetylmuramoyl-tripeptide--D-alanyl-D-alanine ligase